MGADQSQAVEDQRRQMSQQNKRGDTVDNENETTPRQQQQQEQAQQGSQAQAQQQGAALASSSSTFGGGSVSDNAWKRQRKKNTGIRLAANEVQSMPSSKMTQNVELDDNIDEEAFLTTLQSAYGSNAKVELNYNDCNNNINNNNSSNNNSSNNNSRNSNNKRKQLSYQVTFSNKFDATSAYNSNAQVQQQVLKDLGLKGSAIAFDKPCEPKSIDNITLQLDSDSSHILCGACLVFNYKNECIKIVHYCDQLFDKNNTIKHSGDTKVHGKSVHTIELKLSKLDKKNVKQLFFTLCACGPNDLSAFKEPGISLYENDNIDVNLIQYPIEQAENARSVVMCRIFRAADNDTNGKHDKNDKNEMETEGDVPTNNKNNEESEWSIQALGTKEWHLTEKVCMHYGYVEQLIKAHLTENDKKPKKQENDK